MRYLMRSGILYGEREKPLSRLKSIFAGPEKRIYQSDGSLALKTIIQELDVPPEKRADVRSHLYVMLDAVGAEIAVARPCYAQGDDPAVAGWPVCRMPRVDRAAVELQNRAYELFMQDSQTYTLTDAAGYTAVQIMHRGLPGGWNIDADAGFAPEILCGLFAFCRYMEQENEFLVV